MPKHVEQNEQRDGQLSDHASKASALLSARANAVKERASESSKADAEADADHADCPLREAAREDVDAGEPGHANQPHLESFAGFTKRSIRHIIAVAAVALVVAIGVIVAGVAMSSRFPTLAETQEGEPQSYVSPYDWGKLDRSNGRYRYVVDGQVKSRLGIDVSENQHEIDWDAVAADGIDFAYIRVGYRGATAGDLYLDERYWANMDGARNAGLDVGAYFFSQARTVEEAVEEADYVLEYLGGTPLQYPIAFDSEEVVLDLEKSRTTGLSSDEMTAIAEAFCKRVEDAGYSSVVYGNAADLSRYRYDSLEQNTVWWAEYGTSVPAANIDIDYWQYSNSGEVAGIPTAVDMNIDLTHVL